MLQVGFSCLSMSSDNLSAQWTVLPPSINVAAIPEEAMARATSPCAPRGIKKNDTTLLFCYLIPDNLVCFFLILI
jgi:hypothetical protein